MKKRLISLLLALSMALSCAFPVWAEELPAAAVTEEAAAIEIVEEVTEEEAAETAEEPVMEEAPVEEAPAEAPTEEEPAEEEPAEAEEAVPAESAEEAPEETAAEEETITTEEAEVEEAEEKPEDDKSKVVTVKLTSSAAENYALLRDAIRKGSREKKTVRIAKAGSYPVGKSDTAIIHLLPNTDLDLNGATLVRSGGMSNMFLVADENDKYNGTGYNMCSNVTVRNGTLDGSGGAKKDCNLVNIGHASNVVFSDVNFKNCRGAHLIEFTGCRDCRVENCTFTGYTPAANAKEPGEAIQLDISYGGADSSWNGLYKADNTPCKNITITGCTFNSYPSGVGNHHAVKGLHNTGIVITNNTFKNTKNYTAANGDNANYAAIHCYAFEDSIVSGNTITGNYSHGIQISGGSVTVEDNQIGTSSSNFAHPGVLTSYGYDWIRGNSSRSARTKAYVTAGTVADNAVYCSTSSPAVTISNKTKLSKLSNNSVTSSKGHAVYISKSTVAALNSNTLAGKGNSGVYVTGSTLTNIKSNTIKSSKNYGIYLTGSSKATGATSSNKITTCGKSGIYAASNSSVKTVQSNKLTSCKEYGIAVLNKGIKVTVTKNTFSKNKKDLNIKAKGTIQKK